MATSPGEDSLSSLLRYGIEDGASRQSLLAPLKQLLYDGHDGRGVRRVVEHPLGFLCLPLHRSADYGLCLHVWDPQRPPPAEPTTSQVHLHTFGLTSRILAGALVDFRYRVERDELNATHRIFEISQAAGAPNIDLLDPTSETVRATQVGTALYEAGDQYRMDAFAYHSAGAAPGDYTMTIALATNGGNGPQRSLRELAKEATSPPVPHVVRRGELLPEQARQTVRRVFEYI